MRKRIMVSFAIVLITMILSFVISLFMLRCDYDYEVDGDIQIDKDILGYYRIICDEIADDMETAYDKAKEEAEKKRISEAGKRIAKESYNIGSPGVGLCAMWVSMVYNSAGFGYPSGDANDMYNMFANISDENEIEQGMIIAVPSYPYDYMGILYGHVGIMVKKDGEWYVRHNIGYIEETKLDDWIEYYGATYVPKYGWAADI